MKLCKRCIDEIREIAYFEGGNWDEKDGYAEERPVPESECEFWAHVSYNRVRNILKAGIEDMMSGVVSR